MYRRLTFLLATAALSLIGATAAAQTKVSSSMMPASQSTMPRFP
jgi:hypothetical protein